MAPSTAALPLDVHVSKLESWLIDRRKLDAKWEVNADARKRMDAAIARLPDCDQMPGLDNIFGASGSSSASAGGGGGAAGLMPVHFFEGETILKLLEAHKGDSASRNWLGSYKDEELKEWESLLGAYKRRNVHLGEAARLMVQNTDFEVPALKRQLARNQKEAADLLKKKTLTEALIEENKKKYQEKCADIGIKGERPDLVRIQLTGLVGNLRQQLLNIVELMKSPHVGEAISYYAAVAAYLGNGQDAACLPSIAAVRQAASDEEIDELVGSADSNSGSGNANDESTSDAAIDWGFSIESGGLGDLGGLGDAAAALGITMEGAGDGGDVIEIDWDVGADSNVAEVATPGQGEGDAEDLTGGTTNDKGSLQDDGAISLLKSEFRSNVLGDMMQLRAFLTQRCFEINAAEKDGTAIFFRAEDAPECIERTSATQIESYIASVQKVIDAFSDNHLRRMFMIKQQGKNFDMLVTSFHQQLNRIDSLKRSINQMESKIEQTNASSAKLAPKLEHLVARTKRLKASTEAFLSGIFDGTRVNLVGDINSL